MATFGDKQAILYEYVKILTNLPSAVASDGFSKFFNEFNVCFGNLLTLFDDNLELLKVHFSLHTQTVFGKLPFLTQGRLLRENGTAIRSDIVLLHTQLAQEALISRSLIRTDTPMPPDRRPGRTGEKRPDRTVIPKPFQQTGSGDPEIPPPVHSSNPSEANMPFLPVEGMKCRFCDRDHKSSECRTYPSYLRREERLFELSNKFCRRCLSNTHWGRDCTLQIKCRFC